MNSSEHPYLFDADKPGNIDVKLRGAFRLTPRESFEVIGGKLHGIIESMSARAFLYRHRA